LARHLLIRGVVQGVGYRAAFAREADALQLRGWVRNRTDGTVEALVCGDTAAVDAVTEWAQRGPVGAQVDLVSVEEVVAPVETPKRFAILPTA
jgi:acylphosphatase